MRSSRSNPVITPTTTISVATPRATPRTDIQVVREIKAVFFLERRCRIPI
ncbi:MAG: hypothetical protein QGI11_02685 [Nitrospinota bacterium]|nr:hypothetical protein [Nitrospinota bacterium]